MVLISAVVGNISFKRWECCTVYSVHKQCTQQLVGGFYATRVFLPFIALTIRSALSTIGRLHKGQQTDLTTSVRLSECLESKGIEPEMHARTQER